MISDGRWREVAAVVHQLRRRREPFDISATANRLGIELSYHHFNGPVLGAAFGTNVVILQKGLRGVRRDYVFGHELAHILEARGVISGGLAADREFFAEQFARELLLPRSWVTVRPRDPRALARSLRLSIELVALQLSAVGHLPTVFRFNGRVMCSLCGPWIRRPNCDCHSYRLGLRTGGRLPVDLGTTPLFAPRDSPQQLMLVEI